MIMLDTSYLFNKNKINSNFIQRLIKYKTISIQLKLY